MPTAAESCQQLPKVIMCGTGYINVGSAIRAKCHPHDVRAKCHPGSHLKSGHPIFVRAKCLRAKRLRAKCHPGQNVSGQNVTQPSKSTTFSYYKKFIVAKGQQLFYHRFLAKNAMRFSIVFFTSLATSGLLMSPLGSHPWDMSGNSTI